jgi:ribosomal protein S18 acetylase RimI-like enzyme
LKCVDSETGKVVGMALWDIYLTPSAWRKPEISWLEGKDRERAEALVSPLWSAREKMWLDQKYLYCHVIAVRPDYQRKGVGQLLMKYGISVAQQAELPIYIESSKEAVKLYEKMGCRRLKERVEHEADHMSTGDATGTAKDRTVVLFVWVPQAGEEKLPKAVELV